MQPDPAEPFSIAPRSSTARRSRSAAHGRAPGARRLGQASSIYQHEARGADKAITDAIDRHVDDEHRQDDEGDDGPAGARVPA